MDAIKKKMQTLATDTANAVERAAAFDIEISSTTAIADGDFFIYLYIDILDNISKYHDSFCLYRSFFYKCHFFINWLSNFKFLEVN